MNAASHVGPTHTENVEVDKNTKLDDPEFIRYHSEVHTWPFCWDQMIKWVKAKAHVYSDSVKCLVKLSDLSEAKRRWEGQVADFQLPASYEALPGIDGEPIEFELNIFPGFTS